MDVVALRALNTLRLLQLVASNRLADALDTQHCSATIDLVTAAAVIDQVAAELLLRPPSFDVGHS